MLGDISFSGSYISPHVPGEKTRSLINANYSRLPNSDQSQFEQSTPTFKNPIGSAAQRNCRANTEQQQSAALKRIADLMQAADQSLPAYHALQDKPGSPEFAIGLIRKAIKENFYNPSLMLDAVFKKIQAWNLSSQPNQIPVPNFFLGLSPHLHHKNVREYLRASFINHFSPEFFKQLTPKNVMEFLSALDCIFPVTLESNKLSIDISEKRTGDNSAAMRADGDRTVASSFKRQHFERGAGINSTLESQAKKPKTNQNAVLTAEELKINLLNPEISDEKIAVLFLSEMSCSNIDKRIKSNISKAMNSILGNGISIKHFLICLDTFKNSALKNFERIYLIAALETNPNIKKCFDQSVKLRDWAKLLRHIREFYNSGKISGAGFSHQNMSNNLKPTYAEKEFAARLKPYFVIK